IFEVIMRLGPKTVLPQPAALPRRALWADRAVPGTGRALLGMIVLPMVLLALPVSAVAPKLSSTAPAGGQRGTELDLKLNGARLDDAQEIVFYSPGIQVLKFDASKTNSIKARIRIAPDCRLGEHPLRVRTATGVSELRTFYVGAFKGIDEVEPNNEPAKAQKI